MNKETLINTILKDLDEIETMIKSFKGQQDIPTAFINLTEVKLTNLTSEFTLLKNLNSSNTAESNTVDLEKEAEPTIIIEEDIAENTTVDQETILDQKTTITTDPEPIINTSDQSEGIKVKEEVPEPIVTKEPVFSSDEKTSFKTTEVTVQTEEKVVLKSEEINKTIGESFLVEKKSVNDLVSNIQDPNIKKPLKGKPVGDLTKGLGINDRFMFRRELFEGKTEVMNQTLQQLNEMPDFSSAQSFIQSNFNWDDENDVTKSFLSYVERKF